METSDVKEVARLLSSGKWIAVRATEKEPGIVLSHAFRFDRMGGPIDPVCVGYARHTGGSGAFPDIAGLLRTRRVHDTVKP